jgi:hypothetical protein
MLTRRDDPGEYFKKFDLHESLVLRFASANDLKKIDLVFDYAGDAVEAIGTGRWKKGDPVPPRDLRRIVFCNVDRVRHERVRTPVSATASQYSLVLAAEEAIVLEVVGFFRNRDRCHVKFGMGRAGSHDFVFDSMLVDQRFGRATQVGPREWTYRDVDTGQAFEFHEPFDRRWG